MVAPFIGFAGLTVAALIKAVVAEYTANISRKKIAQSYLVERIDGKLESKFGKDFLKNKLTPDRLKQVREVVHEELGAYSSTRDLDQLITNSLSQLTDEHQQMLVALRTAVRTGRQRQEVRTHVVLVGGRPAVVRSAVVEVVQIRPVLEVSRCEEGEVVALVDLRNALVASLLPDLVDEHSIPAGDIVFAAFLPDVCRIG